MFITECSCIKRKYEIGVRILGGVGMEDGILAIIWTGLAVAVVVLMLARRDNPRRKKDHERQNAWSKKNHRPPLSLGIQKQNPVLAVELPDGSHKKFTVGEIDRALNLVLEEKKKAEKLLKTASEFAGGAGRGDLIRILRQGRVSLKENLKELEALNDRCEIAECGHDRLHDRMFELIDDLYSVIDEMEWAIKGPVGYTNQGD